MSALESRAASARRLRFVVLALGAGAVVLAVARTGASEPYWLPWKALLLALLTLLPAYDYVRRAARAPEGTEPLPLLPIIGAIFGVYFALPALLVDVPTFMSARPSSEALDDALNLSLLAWCALLAGYFGLGRIGVSPGRGAFRMDSRRARALAWPFVLVGLGAHAALRMGLVPVALEQPMAMVAWLHQIGVGVGLLLALRGDLGPVARTAVFALGVPSLFLVRLGDWGIGPLVYSALYVLLLVWAARGVVPWKLLLPALVLLVLVKGGVSEFRRVLASTGGRGLQQTERAALLGELVLEHVESRGFGGALVRSAETVRDRVAMLALFAHVVERTPAIEPYWGGSTYQNLPASLIPRAVWPSKPEKTLGQTFGHAYGLLAAQDVETSVNCPQVVELYMNFGAIGVTLGMLLVGFGYRFLVRWLSVPGADDGTLLVGAVLFTRLFNLESDASLVFGTVLQAAVVLFLVLRLFGARE